MHRIWAVCFPDPFFSLVHYIAHSMLRLHIYCCHMQPYYYKKLDGKAHQPFHNWEQTSRGAQTEPNVRAKQFPSPVQSYHSILHLNRCMVNKFPSQLQKLASLATRHMNCCWDFGFNTQCLPTHYCHWTLSWGVLDPSYCDPASSWW